MLNGQPGSLKNRGYVLEPGESLVIEGFRKNEREVAAFRFASPDDAYASNSAAGDSRNLGVIGVALFELDAPASGRERRPTDRRHFPPTPGTAAATRRHHAIATEASSRKLRGGVPS